MLSAAEEHWGERVRVSLADGGYHSGENLRACEERGQPVLMPEPQGGRLANRYHNDRFAYDEEGDGYTCPEGKELTFRGERVRKGLAGVRAEWSLVATAFNLRTLVEVWRRWTPERRTALAGS